ncbi:hypothetical protein SUGI_0715870 [Cryptomeria japonica]|uniref:G-type lectin S-receptor-like serine/threonine-protein kinase LECRK3 n=1 Tax=Cryptomeria japonica TaxID=3369 RepID=UPI0024147739|nr:G-type lectin S-receptor-like serine/threonine-protein kinase LECRK3 [Cryptomeria japonica]GLJ35613.1 hypothetical protein SUGI_0715870 [Cryptomeria japonica]
MGVSVCMALRGSLLRLICVTYLLLAMGVLTRQQNGPCADTGNGFGVCGLNGICLVSGTSPNCSCPPGFDFVEKANPSNGCLQITSHQEICSTNGTKMETIEKVDWPKNDYWHMEFVNQTACQQACIDDCYCTVTIYGNVNGTDNCWKKAMPLRNGVASPTRIAYIKVYSGISEAVPPPPSKVIKEEKGKGLALVGISIMGCSLVVAVILLLLWLLTCRSKLKVFHEQHKFNPIGLKPFSYHELDAATEGFKVEIGRGAFGTVYKGTLADGRAIAVKKLHDLFKKQNPEEGEKEFRTEMGIIAASHHKNLVQLYGFCDEGSHKILVYEYMSNGSLDDRLFKGTKGLDWELRVQILLGTARGLLYLHEECRTHIIHCDIKPQNILLDENYCAKISDFGISKLLGVQQTRTFTLARGTLGYMAPEWQKTMAVCVKVDVYSFGVLLLEVICSRKMLQLEVPENEIMLSDWVYDCFKHGRLAKLVEQQECRGMEVRQLERMVLVGFWCIQEDPFLRPSIKKVLQMLEGTVEITVPPNPIPSSLHSGSNSV